MYMDLIIILLTILQSVAIALGVGSSTLAISNFFVAIADGEIDKTERKMMGVVYIVLRVAMGLILTTTAFLTALRYVQFGVDYFTPFVVGLWILIIMLFVNAFLMTKHIMPSSMGPALQAASWYTMGTLMALFSLGLYQFNLIQFILGYIVTILFAILIVNTVMVLLKRKS